MGGHRGGGAVAVAVATGPTPALELGEAGADVVLDDLTAFGPWWTAWTTGAWTRHGLQVEGTS